MNAWRRLAVLGLALGCAAVAHAARVGDVAATDLGEQVARFLSLRDPAVRTAVAGAALLGVCCGVLGGFVGQGASFTLR